MRQNPRLFWIFSGLLVCLLCGVGCKRDKCKHVTCVHGTCADGNCICEKGYFGSDCHEILNAGYTGTWNVVENCTAGADHYPITLVPSVTDFSQLGIVGIWGRLDTVFGTIGGENSTFDIANQPIPHSGYMIDGHGTINATHDKFTILYNIYDAGAAQPFDVCTANISKN